MEFLANLRKAITWLGGAIAALTVLCYGAGYFALHAYLRMLGLDRIVPVKADQMLIEGAEFWRWLLSNLVLCLTYVIVIALVLYIIVQHISPVRRAVTSVRRGTESLWTRVCSKFPRIESFCILVLFLAALQLHSYTFDSVQALSTDQSSLLFTRGARPTFNSFLGDGSTGVAISYFALLLLLAVAFSRKLERDVSRTAVLIVRVGLTLYFAVYTLSLPPTYGVLTHNTIYPRVLITGQGISGQARLLYQDDSSLVLWLPKQHKAVWLPLHRVDVIQAVGPPADILK